MDTMPNMGTRPQSENSQQQQQPASGQPQVNTNANTDPPTQRPENVQQQSQQNQAASNPPQSDSRVQQQAAAQDKPTQYAVADTGQQVVERPPRQNLYAFDDREQQLFGDFDLDTPIARAWSRLSRAGHYVGKPVDVEEDLNDRIVQDFQFAQASMLKNDNPNQEVSFTDARGLIGTERGL